MDISVPFLMAVVVLGNGGVVFLVNVGNDVSVVDVVVVAVDMLVVNVDGSVVVLVVGDIVEVTLVDVVPSAVVTGPAVVVAVVVGV